MRGEELGIPSPHPGCHDLPVPAVQIVRERAGALVSVRRQSAGHSICGRGVYSQCKLCRSMSWFQVQFLGKAVDAPVLCDDWCRGRRSVRWYADTSLWAMIALSLSVVWCSCSFSNVSPSSSHWRQEARLRAETAMWVRVALRLE